MSSLNFWNMGNTVPAALIFFSAQSNICICPVSVPIDCFIFSLWIVLSCFFAWLVIFLLDSRHLDFILLGAGYFCIPINTLELCSRIWLDHLEIVWSFGSCFSDLLVRTGAAFSLGLISPYYWGNTLLDTLCLLSSMNLEVFKSSCWGHTPFPALCECQSITFNLLGWFFSLASESFLTCMCWSVLS